MDNAQEILDRARREIAARKRVVHEQPSDQAWLWAFAALGVTLLLGLLFLPIRGLDYRLQMIVHGVCAQEHFLRIGAMQMPLCARNTGIYAAVSGTLLFLLVMGRARAAALPSVTITLALMVGAIAMVVDGVNSLLLDVGGLNFYPPRNELRVITGLLMGSAIGVFLVLMFNLALRQRPETGRPILASWVEYLALLLVNVGLYILIFFGPTALFYPLAILSVAGILGVLFIANLFVAGMIGGFESRVSHLPQLARPALIALALTSAELALLAGLRIWIEGSMAM